MFEYIVIGLVAGMLIAAAVYYVMGLRLQHQRELLQTEFELDFKNRESKLRKQIADAARRVIKGQIAEHLAPLLSHDLEDFVLSDMCFIGSPIDFLIIDGYTELKDVKVDRDITIILADVKTGKARLTKEQSRIKDACEAGRVKWMTIRLLEEMK